MTLFETFFSNEFSVLDKMLIVNTLKSHCMLDYAKSEGKQDQLAENLFKAYFEEARDINSTDVLAKVAADTGLNLDAMEK